MIEESAISALGPMLQLELETLRDQRDLYRSLLLSEMAPLGAFMSYALESVERLREELRQPTRDTPAFRGKIARLQAELAGLAEAMLGLHLPSILSRLDGARLSLQQIDARSDITGNDLLPALVTLEELCSHLLIAADCAAVHVPLAADAAAAEELELSERRAVPKLTEALRALSDKICAERHTQLELVTMGLEDVPDSWVSALFDLLGELLRNAIEHGIEAGPLRLERSKPATGTLVIEFTDRGAQGFELDVLDDGAGLDAERLAEAAVRRGLLSAEAAKTLEAPRLAALIFQPGITTTGEGTRRGNGMQIVKDHVARLGGKLHVATKRGQFTRFRMQLPAIITGERGERRQA
jgi:signal transduction histidine kinase